MQFSMAKFLCVVVFINIVVAATFALPTLVGLGFLTLISLVVLPPFLIVGAFNTRGIRQSFFLGAMVAGVPHFVINTYFVAIYGFSAFSGDVSVSDLQEAGLSFIHLAG